MIVINLTDIIIISIILLIIVISIIKIIIEEIKKIGKKNCYECKNYKLYDVCSCGDGCRYQCIKNVAKYPILTSLTPKGMRFWNVQ